MGGGQCLVVDNGGFSSISSTYAREPGRVLRVPFTPTHLPLCH